MSRHSKMPVPAPHHPVSGRRRTIVHADLDAFFASVEQRDHPQWRGKPVIVGAAPDCRGVVCAASYEARKYGVRSAMPSSQAGKLCPDGIFVPPDSQRYRDASRAVFACFDLFTPIVEPLSIDEAFLDVTGSLRLFGDEHTLARRLKETVLSRTGLVVSVGVAPNKFLAKLAGEQGKPDGLTVAPFDANDIRGFLAPLPVDALWGVGPATVTRLQRGGLRTIRDIQNVPIAKLRDIVGAHAAQHFKALAGGIDPRGVSETREQEQSISRETTFPEDCRDQATIMRVTGRLADEVGARLRRRTLYASTAMVKIRYQGFRTVTRRRRLQRPCRDDATLREAALAILADIPLKEPVRLVGFGVADLDSSCRWQPTLFDPDGELAARRERLSQSVDAVRTRFGPESIQRVTNIGSNPERTQA